MGETTAVIVESAHYVDGELVRLPLVEVGMGGVVFGRSLGDQFTAYGSAAGAIGLAAQVIFATLPV